jgi:acetyl esterase/lipase
VRRFQALLDSGFTVFAVRHGSSPRFNVLEAVEDVQKALQFVHANATDFGVDPDRLGVHGGSAGGHLSLMLGLAPAGSSENSPSGLIAAVVAYFPPVDIRQMVGPSRRFPALEFEPSQAPSISPILFASADDPPTLLVHGTADTLVPIRNSETMLAALQEQNVPVELLVLEGAGHGFRGEDGQRASAALVAWFEKYLSPEKE